MAKSRPLRPTFGSSNGKEVVGSSSMAASGMTSARRSGKESHRKYSSNIENKLSDASSLHEDPEVLKKMQSSTERQFQFDSAKRDTGSSKVMFAEVGCSSGTSRSRPQKIFGHGPGSSNQKSPMNSSVSSSSKSISVGTRSSSSGEGYRMRNLNGNSIPDVLPYSSSPPDENEDDGLPGAVPFTSAEIGINRFMNPEALQRYNMDGVAQEEYVIGDE